MFKRSPALYVEINFYQYPSSRAVNKEQFLVYALILDTQGTE